MKFEERLLCFDGLDELEPDRHLKVQRALAARGERTIVCASSPQAVVALGEATAIVVEVPPASFAERRDAWTAADRPA